MRDSARDPLDPSRFPGGRRAFHALRQLQQANIRRQRTRAYFAALEAATVAPIWEQKGIIQIAAEQAAKRARELRSAGQLPSFPPRVVVSRFLEQVERSVQASSDLIEGDRSTIMATQVRSRYQYIDNFLNSPGPTTDPDFVPGAPTIASLEASKVLVIGAGGLGCEILKNLAMSGFRDIHVIDMDVIDVSNLNRQFLFRKDDVGKSKAEVAAASVMSRCKDVRITPFNGKIQDKDEEFYMQFKIVISGLDSIEARRWINATLVSMVDMENPDSLKPLIDGGTEGFKGQARVILPTLTSCIECQLDMHAPRAAVPLCTLATIPRQPEHCIEWAKIIAWEEHRKDTVLDTDDPEHITWLYDEALNRAKEFNIPGVTYQLTQGVVKNIIPAIASTNAIIAAACCNEAFKIATSCNPYLNNYMMYTGDDSIYTYTFEHEQKTDCPVCGNLAKTITVNPKHTLQQFIESLGERPEAQLKKPTLRTESTSLYFQSPPSLEEQTRQNLMKKLSELISDGEEIGVSDPAFTIDFKFKLVFQT